MPYRTIEDPANLRRLLQAVLLLEADLSLPVLLRHFVEEARSMTGAQYAALGLLDEERTGLADFITVGLSAEAEERIGHRPTGLGVLGLLITDPRPLRLADISAHPKSAGFPPGHPQMTSFLGVPVSAHDEVYGNLYLTNKIGWEEFTRDDEALVTAFAQAAGIAIENARLHQRVQDMAVLEDRDRIARDLHDAVIQRLFAVGLSLQAVARPPLPSPTVERIQRAIGDIDDTIRQIRTTIFELASDPDGGRLRSRVLEVVHELRPVLGFEVPVTFEGPVDVVGDDLAEQLTYVVREALTNVQRHAHASRASVRLRVADGTFTLEVLDDGRGVRASQTVALEDPPGDAVGAPRGFGIVNMRRRAEKLGGELLLESPVGGGTALVWRVPVD